VEGDSFDRIGYKFRCTTEQLLQYNPSLAADRPIPAGTRVRLVAGELKIDGAQGTFTADADGIPQTYTTAPGDTERQISFRSGMPDLEWANRPLTGTGRVWYNFTDLPSGELARPDHQPRPEQTPTQMTPGNGRSHATTSRAWSAFAAQELLL
jgi:hypothetical protein